MSDSDDARNQRRTHDDRGNETRSTHGRREVSQERDRKRHRSLSRQRSISDDRDHDKHKRRRASPPQDVRSKVSYNGHDRDRHNRDYHRQVDRNDDSYDGRRDSHRHQRRRDRPRSRSRSVNRSSNHRDRSGSKSPRHNNYHRKRRRSRSNSQSPGRRKASTRIRQDSDRRSSRERSSRHHRRSYSRSPPPSNNRSAPESQAISRRARGPLPSQQEAFTTNRGPGSGSGPSNGEKQKPNYQTSGKLAAETNTVSIGGEAIILKYHEPPEARKPPSAQAWRMYEFKGENADPLSTTELCMRSCWLFGRETAVVDFLIEHPSCSKQHAVIQFRYVEKRSEFGDKIGAVKPYLLDLESANGTLVNGEKIPDRRYIELKSGDSVGFGESTRDYVILLPPRDKGPSE